MASESRKPSDSPPPPPRSTTGQKAVMVALVLPVAIAAGFFGMRMLTQSPPPPQPPQVREMERMRLAAEKRAETMLGRPLTDSEKASIVVTDVDGRVEATYVGLLSDALDRASTTHPAATSAATTRP